MTDADLLELLNGAVIVPGAIVIGLLTRYLIKEAKRRGLRRLDWSHFPPRFVDKDGVRFRWPPPMNLMLAMFIFVVAVWGEKVSKWAWRFFGSGPFGISLSAVLIFFGSFIVIGSLCKVRALTRPDFGNGPWLVSSLLTVLAIVALLFT